MEVADLQVAGVADEHVQLPPLTPENIEQSSLAFLKPHPETVELRHLGYPLQPVLVAFLVPILH